MKDDMNGKAVAPLKLGKTVISARAKEVLNAQEVLSALWRHANEPWGKCFDPANEASEISIREDRRLISNHSNFRGDPFKIITEGEGTIVFLPGETDLSSAGSLDAWVCNLACPSCG